MAYLRLLDALVGMIVAALLQGGLAATVISTSLILLKSANLARAQDQLSQGKPAQTSGAVVAPALYNNPVLVVDPDMHTAKINRVVTDFEERWAVTASDDKTVRVWSVENGVLLQTIRLPAGSNDLGTARAVAINPNGTSIAIGGAFDDQSSGDHILICDRESGAIVDNISKLPGDVDHLAFSPDGRFLVAAFARGGLRIYERKLGWIEIARDTAYNAAIVNVKFTPDGERLATSASDGKVRLYSGGLNGELRPNFIATLPYFGGLGEIAFSPDGTRLAVGSGSRPAVALLDARTLRFLAQPTIFMAEVHFLPVIAWSHDGSILFAGGGAYIRQNAETFNVILAWPDGGSKSPQMLQAGLGTSGTLMDIVPLRGGDLLAVTSDPQFARLQKVGPVSWSHGSQAADFRNQAATLSVSSDGSVIDFGFGFGNITPARFDLGMRTLSLSPAQDGRTVPPRQESLPILDWLNAFRPTLLGRPLRLEPYEESRSLAVHPSGDRFVLGAEWTLRAYRSDGTILWISQTPSVTWAVNITGDGRLVVAAYGDGTIRWHRMSDGAELLAFRPLQDRSNWVAWTPEGIYDATAGAHGVLRWHVNHGWDHAAESVPVEDIPGLRRPDTLPLVLQELETARAVGFAELSQIRKQVVARTHNDVPPGAGLHVLAIGISDYSPQNAESLRLHYADRDAIDLRQVIIETQRGTYAKILPQLLVNKDASRSGILRALDKMQTNMERGDGQDLAIVFFSGHGALVRSKLYLLPYDVESDAAGIGVTAIPVDQLRDSLVRLAQHGRVLVLLDACHSGAITDDGVTLEVNSTAFRDNLAMHGVSVITLSTGSQVSREYSAWRHGAFTKALLDAFDESATDLDRIGRISMSGLVHYRGRRIPALTDGSQTPEFEVRFDGAILAPRR